MMLQDARDSGEAPNHPMQVSKATSVNRHPGAWTPQWDERSRGSPPGGEVWVRGRGASPQPSGMREPRCWGTSSLKMVSPRIWEQDKDGCQRVVLATCYVGISCGAEWPGRRNPVWSHLGCPLRPSSGTEGLWWQEAGGDCPIQGMWKQPQANMGNIQRHCLGQGSCRRGPRRAAELPTGKKSQHLAWAGPSSTVPVQGKCPLSPASAYLSPPRRCQKLANKLEWG